MFVRLEYSFFDVILYADGDEFFFCPQATTKEVLEQQVISLPFYILLYCIHEPLIAPVYSTNV